MIREKKTFNEAVIATIESGAWPSTKEIKNMASRQMCSRDYVNDASLRNNNTPPASPRPQNSSSSNEPPKNGPPPYKGRPPHVPADPSRDFDRWKDKRHTICLKWKQNQCKYTADECNRAHGERYLRK